MNAESIIRVQANRRGDRWAYIIDDTGDGYAWPFISRHIFHSPDAAREAGEKDAALTRAFKADEDGVERDSAYSTGWSS